jgi:hypothetical protein
VRTLKAEVRVARRQEKAHAQTLAAAEVARDHAETILAAAAAGDDAAASALVHGSGSGGGGGGSSGGGGGGDVRAAAAMSTAAALEDRIALQDKIFELEVR